MDRDKKVFLCVKSLLNISKDIVEVYKDYSDILLFIADKIAQKEQERERKGESYQIHGGGKEHDLNKKCTCGDDSCECEITPEEDVIEKEIDDMILTVKKEMESVSD